MSLSNETHCARQNAGLAPVHQSTTAPLSPHFDFVLAPNGPVLTAILERFPHALAVYAFGSQIQGTAGPESDQDLAVLVAAYADPVQRGELAGSLADVVGCRVDLLDLRAASSVMQYQVITKGCRLWVKGIDADLFESFFLSEKRHRTQRNQICWQIQKKREHRIDSETRRYG